MSRFLVEVTLTMAVLNVVVAVLLAIRRISMTRREGKLRRAEECLKTAVLDLIDDGDSYLPLRSHYDIIALSHLLQRYARLLTGSSRRKISHIAKTSGLVEREMKAMRSRRSWRRAAAAMVLGDLGTERAIPLLIRGLSDRSVDVRTAAARSLGTLGGVDGIPRIIRQMASGRLPRALAAETLMTIGSAARSGVENLLNVDDPAVRASASELLGLIGEVGEAVRLSALLADPDPEVRVKTARAIGRVGAADAVTHLRRTLEDPVPYVRAAAARALATVGDTESLGALVAMAKTDTYDAARAAAEAVAELDSARLEPEVEKGGSPHLAEALDLVRV